MFETTENIKATWLGGTPTVSFWPGIPARDLTESEWNEIEPHIQRRVIQVGMYQLTDAPAETQTKKAGNK